MTSMTRRDFREARRSAVVRVRGADLARQATMVAAMLMALAGAAWGSGMFAGVPIREAQNGALAPDASLLAPAGAAFTVWGLLYLLLVGYAVWQLLPGQRARQRHRDVGWWIAAVAALEGVWIATARVSVLWFVIAVMWVLVV